MEKKAEKKSITKSDDQSVAYIVASSVLISGMAVAAVVFYFGLQIMGGINDIRYQYDAEAPLSEQSISYYAHELGINVDKFVECANSDKYSDVIDEDLEDAKALHIDGTPGFYAGEYISDTEIRGFLIPGAYPYEVFEQTINSLNANGVDGAFEEMTSVIRDQMYESRLSSQLQYYQGQEGLSAEEAQIKAAADAAAYTNERWVIREVDVGTLTPLKEGDPKIAIIEFTDFECPYCKRHAQQTIPLIEDTFVSNGTVAYYVRNVPLESIHPDAMTGATAGFCADEKGDFWEFHHLLFEVD